MWTSILRKILIKELNLQAKQVIPGNFNCRIPEDGKLYIVLHNLTSNVYANSKNYSTVDDNFTLTQGMHTSEKVTVSLFAYNKRDESTGSTINEALTRRHEVLLALSSEYAEEMQHKHNFRLAEVPPSAMIDVSGVEGKQNMWRFDIEIPALVLYTKQSQAGYIESADVEVMLA